MVNNNRLLKRTDVMAISIPLSSSHTNLNKFDHLHN